MKGNESKEGRKEVIEGRKNFEERKNLERRKKGRKEGKKVRTEGWKDGSYRRERWEKEKSNHEDGKEQRKAVLAWVDGPSWEGNQQRRTRSKNVTWSTLYEEEAGSGPWCDNCPSFSLPVCICVPPAFLLGTRP